MNCNAAKMKRNPGMERRLQRARAFVATLLFLCLTGIIAAEHLLAQEAPSLAGQLLVAAPDMGDPRFIDTVIFIVRHNGNGAMGLVINRPLAKGSLSHFLRRLGVESKNARGEIVLHYGGPVEPARAFVLHTTDYTSRDTTVVSEGLAITTDLGIMQAIGQGKGPKRSIFCVGYAGWAPGQLEAEMKADAWFSIPAEDKLIFEGDPETKWEKAMARRRIKA